MITRIITFALAFSTITALSQDVPFTEISATSNRANQPKSDALIRLEGIFPTLKRLMSSTIETNGETGDTTITHGQGQETDPTIISATMSNENKRYMIDAAFNAKKAQSLTIILRFPIRKIWERITGRFAITGSSNGIPLTQEDRQTVQAKCTDLISILQPVLPREYTDVYAVYNSDPFQIESAANNICQHIRPADTSKIIRTPKVMKRKITDKLSTSSVKVAKINRHVTKPNETVIEEVLDSNDFFNNRYFTPKTDASKELVIEEIFDSSELYAGRSLAAQGLMKIIPHIKKEDEAVTTLIESQDDQKVLANVLDTVLMTLSGTKK
jgi:hypothetical protein